MNIAETLLEADHGFAVDGKAEMARLDDAGMHLSDRRKLAVPAFDRHDDDLALLEQRHVHLTGIPPQTEQRRAACRKLRGEHAPSLRAHDDARSGLVLFDPMTWNPVDQHGPILKAWRRSGTM